MVQKDGKPVFSYPETARPAKKKERAKASGQDEDKPSGDADKTPETVS